MAAVDEVRQASAQFYAALNRMANGDGSAMGDIWSHSGTVTTMHPIGGREVGWENVQGPWLQVAQLCSGGTVRLEDQRIEATNELAYEVGDERGEITMAGRQMAIEHRVTNVYRREADGWKIVHHHTDLSPAMVELLKTL
jgi:ketosteroid isomerase-like protein